MLDLISTSEIEVPFYDVDVMQVVWHGHYVKYMEIARCELLDKLGYNYQQMKASGFAWPVVELQIKYVKPLKFKQKILIEATMTEVEYGMKINFVFLDKLTGVKLTKGFTKQVAVNIKTGDMCLISPDVLQQKINAYYGS